MGGARAAEINQLSTCVCVGFLLEKSVGVYQPQRITDAKILLANTAMDHDKIKVFGSKVRVQSTAKLAEIEQAEKVSLTSSLCRNL